MVKIVVRGQSENISKEETKEAFSFFSDELLGRRLSKNVRISVTFDPFLFEMDQDYGYVYRTDVARRPRKFSVKIDAQLNKKKALLTIAHEVTHIKQYCRGELKDMRGYAKKWMGEIYDETIDYKDQPWEADALKMEPLLYEAWIDYKKEVKYGKGTFDRDVA